jgi:AbrB family looped-hinge helix DNA binding protein
MVDGILNGMELHIDRAGRIVVPKQVREHLGLKPGSCLRLEESAGSLILRKVDPEPSLIEIDGLLAHTGKLHAGYDWESLVAEDREDRIRELIER